MRVERRHSTARRAEEHHRATAPETGQRRVERGLADTVVHRGDTRAIGEFADPGVETVVAEHLVGPGATRQVALLAVRVGNGREHLGAQDLCDLGEQQTDTTGAGVYQYRITGLDRVGAGRQVVRGDPLQRDRRRLFELDAGRYGDQLGCGPDHLGGVGTVDGLPADTITDRDTLDAATDLDDLAGTLATRGERKRNLVPALASVDVDEVDAGCRDAHANLAVTGLPTFTSCSVITSGPPVCSTRIACTAVTNCSPHPTIPRAPLARRCL